jgi:dTDP-4-amino-4,6-dideoxygalactose transaminase
LIRDDSPMTRDELAVALLAQGISVRQGTHAVHIQGYYRSKYGLHPEDFPQALKADRQSLTLPLYQTMSSEEQAWVIHHVVNLLG